jgi:O-acetyl-ADP-ribose deacetylase
MILSKLYFLSSVLSVSVVLLPLVHAMSSNNKLIKLATYTLRNTPTNSKKILLHIVQGSVVDFCHSNGAIVNAANTGCLGGGGVDGAITSAGGPSLAEDRKALPILDLAEEAREGGVRCPTGQAKLTGPGKYGSLNVPYVIHAVGPAYYEYEEEEESYPKLPDSLLQSAYRSSLGYAKDTTLDPPIQEIAFALLSAGVFRGDREVSDIFRLSVSAILDFCTGKTKTTTEDNKAASTSSSKDDGTDKHDDVEVDCGTLEAVTMCAFNQKEASELIDACEFVLGRKRRVSGLVTEQVEAKRQKSPDVVNADAEQVDEDHPSDEEEQQDMPDANVAALEKGVQQLAKDESSIDNQEAEPSDEKKEDKPAPAQ